tara:strand:- start:2674 stop:3273 length:600 start_codon:yes stop_codon:yes gene_type:complete
MLSFKDTSITQEKAEKQIDGLCKKQDGVTMTNIIDVENSKKLVSFIQKNKSEGQDSPAGVVKTSDVILCPWYQLQNKLPYLLDKVYHANSHYFGFEIDPTTADQALNLNTYRPGQEYKYHQDGSDYATNDLKLTCLLNVSTEPYEGGDFYLKYGEEDKKIEFPPGSLFVFKPYVFHRVTPVTKGVRRTLTLWMYGPRWR